MNAKKIMGAVLVALLAAALFVGAGAAVDHGTVFLYQNTSVAGANGTLPDGVYTFGAAQVSVTGKVPYPGANFTPGSYKFGDHTVYFTYPVATYAPTAKVNGKIPYLVSNGGTVYNNTTLSFVFGSASTVKPSEKYLVTYPNGTAVKLNKTQLGASLVAEKCHEGTYKIQAIFEEDKKFVTGVPTNFLLDATGFTYTIIGDDDATMTASAKTFYVGDAFTLTIKGTPGVKYKLDPKDVFIAKNQYVTIGNDWNFTMPNNGEVSFQAVIDTTAKDTASVALKKMDNTEIEKIEFTVSAAVITVTLGKDSYYIGDTIVLSGTSTTGITKVYDFYITGTNFKKTILKDTFKKEGKEWKVELPTKDVNESGGAKKLDVGTYTISIQKGDVVVKTVAVALRQPFISILEAPTTVAQKTEAKFVVNAEASADSVKAYVFGQNYFSEVPEGQISRDKDVKSKYTVKLTEDNTNAPNMSTGEYFLVVQHPMYDGKFNIMQDNGTFYLNTSGNAVPVGTNSSKLFNVYDRQTANAAQALCDELDNQNIDDMYVKYSFFVVGQEAAFSISEIPSEVIKGTQIVISGVDTANKGKTVVVEMLSTRFAVVAKDDVNAAAFIVVTADIAKDGTWEVVLDTSDLAIDEYGVSVKTGDSVKKNAIVNVIEGAPVTPTEQPTVVPTDAPVTPTEDPKTPGFGALAALAGLGAVAVLLLRRE